MKKLVSIVPALALAATAACSDATTGRVGLAFSTRPAPAGAFSAMAVGAISPSLVANGDSTVVTMGNDTIVIRSVELVLREVELERIEVEDCDLVASEDACEEFAVGPVLVSLPLGNTTEKTITVNVEPGTYDEVEFEIHKPDEVADAAFIAANPDFADISIRVTGTYSQAGTRSDFTFTSDLNEEQERAIVPPLVVAEGGATNVTIRIDLATWFVNAGGTALVDPSTANKGGPNENVVRDNIRNSIDAFHDDDSDGLCDDTEGS